MHIHISPKDGVPIYRQIIQQIKYLVASGRLQPGDELLPIRALAKQLIVNPNTVARAYRDLEAQGVTESKQGSGTHIRMNGASPLARTEKVNILTERADALLTEANQLGIEPETLIDLIRQRYQHLNPNGDQT